MEQLQQIASGIPVSVEVTIREDDLIKTTTYLTGGIFIAVLLAVIIANKIS